MPVTVNFRHALQVLALMITTRQQVYHLKGSGRYEFQCSS